MTKKQSMIISESPKYTKVKIVSGAWSEDVWVGIPYFLIGQLFLHNIQPEMTYIGMWPDLAHLVRASLIKTEVPWLKHIFGATLLSHKPWIVNTASI